MMLRSVLPADLEIFFEHQRDPDALRMAAMPGRDRGTFTKHWQTKVLGEPSVKVQTVMHDGEVAGTINSFESNGRRLVGYFFEKAYWGKGIASQALQEFLKIRVLEKNGFVFVEEVPNRLDDGVTEILLKLE
ncbi:MAG: GNAT family N-acetyltransferase [Polyangiaceae bacterium]